MAFKIGDRVRLKKDGELAVVTHAVTIEGKKQERIEITREDNGSVFNVWFDDVERAAKEPAPRVEPAVAEEPVASPRSGRKGKAKASV